MLVRGAIFRLVLAASERGSMGSLPRLAVAAVAVRASGVARGSADGGSELPTTTTAGTYAASAHRKPEAQRAEAQNLSRLHASDVPLDFWERVAQAGNDFMANAQAAATAPRAPLAIAARNEARRETERIVREDLRPWDNPLTEYLLRPLVENPVRALFGSTLQLDDDVQGLMVDSTEGPTTQREPPTDNIPPTAEQQFFKHLVEHLSAWKKGFSPCSPAVEALHRGRALEGVFEFVRSLYHPMQPVQPLPFARDTRLRRQIRFWLLDKAANNQWVAQLEPNQLERNGRWVAGAEQPRVLNPMFVSSWRAQDEGGSRQGEIATLEAALARLAGAVADAKYRWEIDAWLDEGKPSAGAGGHGLGPRLVIEVDIFSQAQTRGPNDTYELHEAPTKAEMYAYTMSRESRPPDDEYLGRVELKFDFLGDAKKQNQEGLRFVALTLVTGAGARTLLSIRRKDFVVDREAYHVN
eukprot:g3639.t1